MLDNVNWDMLILMSGTLFASLRVMKPRIYALTKRLGFDEDTQKLSVLLWALLGGIVIVAFGGEQVSIIKGTHIDTLYPFMGKLATGFAIALGSNGIHFVETLFSSINDFVKRLAQPPELPE